MEVKLKICLAVRAIFAKNFYNVISQTFTCLVVIKSGEIRHFCNMNELKASFLFFVVAIASGFNLPMKGAEYVSPLHTFSSEWNDVKYAGANTAANADYLSHAEKEVIHILNLARINPALFCNTVVMQYPTRPGKSRLKDSDYFQSLLLTLKKQQPLNLLVPDQVSFESARCHATYSGETGYIGHNRKSTDCKKISSYMGECCDYGHNNPLDIVMSLLIDEGIPSLGHRTILLSPYRKIGVSIQPHKTYRYNTVIDFN